MQPGFQDVKRNCKRRSREKEKRSLVEYSSGILHKILASTIHRLIVQHRLDQKAVAGLPVVVVAGRFTLKRLGLGR
jgi:hypothetical protein